MIYAIDFDGTIVENKFPAIGELKPEAASFISALKERGDKWILYTMREGPVLDEALTFLREKGLVPDAVNDNLPEMCDFYHNNPRKVFANVYIDDHNAGGLQWERPEKSTRRKQMNKKQSPSMKCCAFCKHFISPSKYSRYCLIGSVSDSRPHCWMHRNYIDGKPIPCESARSLENLCGMEARYYEAKPPQTMPSLKNLFGSSSTPSIPSIPSEKEGEA